jgi:hypothetical protein
MSALAICEQYGLFFIFARQGMETARPEPTAVEDPSGAVAAELRRQRLALTLSVVMFMWGLIAGGCAAFWIVARWQSDPQVVSRAPTPQAMAGGVEQLRTAGTIFFTDQEGRLLQQRADGQQRKLLGMGRELAGSPRPPPLHRRIGTAAGFLSGPTGGRSVMVAPDGESFAAIAPDGGAVAGQLSRASVQRLLPPGWEAADLPKTSADGSLRGVCGFSFDARGAPGLKSVRSWAFDPSGRTLASLPGCLYDVAADGSAVLAADPKEGRRVGPLRVRSEERRSVESLPGDFTRGLRLWRPDGGTRRVLGFSELQKAVAPIGLQDAGKELVIVAASLSPDVRHALVLVGAGLANRSERGPSLATTALLLVDLANEHVELVPSRNTQFAFWLPTGGLVDVDEDGLVTHRLPGQPPMLLHTLDASRSTPVIEASPDGSWIVIADDNWTFVRVDDPSSRVFYKAPGWFAGWGRDTR